MSYILKHANHPRGKVEQTGRVTRDGRNKGTTKLCKTNGHPTVNRQPIQGLNRQHITPR